MSGMRALRQAIVLSVLILLAGIIYALYVTSYRLHYGVITITRTIQSYGTLHMHRNLAEGPLRIRSRSFDDGIGTHANSEIRIVVPSGSRSFTGFVGIDATASGSGAVVFSVEIEGREVFKSPVITGIDAAVPFSLDLKGNRSLVLRVRPGPSGSTYAAHADWVSLRVG